MQAAVNSSQSGKVDDFSIGLFSTNHNELNDGVPYLIVTLSLSPTITPTPTHTPSPATYIFEWGICKVDVTMNDLFADNTAGSPGQHPGCLAVGRTQYVLGYGPTDNSYAYWNMPQIYTNMGEEAWCTLKALDGSFIQGALDTIGAGKVTCGLK
jgi:hypothetical protein